VPGMIGEFFRRVWYVLNRRRMERLLESEMAAHRESMGDPRRFGNVLKLREDAAEVWVWRWLDTAMQDFRYGLRVLARVPSFSLTAFVILTAGVGLNLTFFHLVNVIALQPLAVKDPATLVRLERRGKTFSSSGVPFPATQFIREHSNVSSAVLTRQPSDVVWDAETAARLHVSFVSANWFAELGHDAALGRVFSEAIDDKAGAQPVAIVSHGFWASRTGSDPQIVGRTAAIKRPPDCRARGCACCWSARKLPGAARCWSSPDPWRAACNVCSPSILASRWSASRSSIPRFRAMALPAMPRAPTGRA